MESPYHFPEMDLLHVPDDHSSEPPAPAPLHPQLVLPPLPTIPGCTMLRPGDAGYAAYVTVYNGRTQVAPALFAVCSTAAAVAAVFGWVKANNLPFVVRSGGHSYEGYSCSSGVVIDLKKLAYVNIDQPNITVT